MVAKAFPHYRGPRHHVTMLHERAGPRPPAMPVLVSREPPARRLVDLEVVVRHRVIAEFEEMARFEFVATVLHDVRPGFLLA